jgi:NADH-quinone oxidoreductase subunit J
MNGIFFISASVAVISAVMVITRRNAVHALLYLVVSFLSVGLIFFIFGAPFAAALEVIIYAGAIMVLFVFVVMMFDLGGSTPEGRQRLAPGTWLGPGILSLILIVELVYTLFAADLNGRTPAVVGPGEVAAGLFGPYALGVELASMLLLAGLTGACHLARRTDQVPGRDGGKRR